MAGDIKPSRKRAHIVVIYGDGGCALTVIYNGLRGPFFTAEIYMAGFFFTLQTDEIYVLCSKAHRMTR